MKFVAALSTIVAFASQASATMPPSSGSVPTFDCASVACGTAKIVHFDDFSRGDYLASDAYESCGIENMFCANKDGQDAHECRIFDTEVPYGNWIEGELCSGTDIANADDCGDLDLLAPFYVQDDPNKGQVSPGKVIIYDEAGVSGDQTSPPDDNEFGAQFVFEFTNPVTIHQIEYLDIEEQDTTITFFYEGKEPRFYNVAKTENAKMRIVEYTEAKVKKIQVKLEGSGAVSAIKFTEEVECPFKPAGGGGDPHLQLWGREKYSFHGECDLVMVKSDQFKDNQGLDLHIRTTIQDYFSYIERAALRVGSNILEVQKKSILLDGVQHKAKDLPLLFGDDEHKYTLSEVKMENKNYNVYKLDLGSSSMVFKFYKQFLTISIDGHTVDFGDSVGLLGDYANGEMLGRRGQLISEAMDFGFEWQVTADEPMLFQEARSPQLPYERCRMPSVARPSRRKLRGADLVLRNGAQEACAAQKGNDFDLCVEDVMATGDLGLAGVW